MNNKSGIYKIVNLVNGKVYVGRSKNLLNRKYNHFSKLRNKKHKNKYLQRSFTKHGEDNFIFEVIEYCDEKELTKREKYHLSTYDDSKTYNLVSVDENNNYKVSSKTRQKQRDIGRQRIANVLGDQYLEIYKLQDMSNNIKEYISNNYEVSRYTLKGDYIETFKSLMSALEKHPKIKRLLNKALTRPQNSMGSIWCFDCCDHTTKSIKGEVSKRGDVHKNNAVFMEICNLNYEMQKLSFLEMEYHNYPLDYKNNDY